MQCIRLQQPTIEFDGLQQLAQSRDRTAGLGGIAGLGNRHVYRLGLAAGLGVR